MIYPVDDVPCPAPAGFDSMPMKVVLSSHGGWETASSEAGDSAELASDSGSWPREAGVRPAAHTPLRASAALFRPAADDALPAGGQHALAGASAGGRPQKAGAPARGPRSNNNNRSGRRAAEQPRSGMPTTVMFCNTPFCYTCDSLMDLMNSMGFARQFNFVYMPINMAEMRSVGYAFVNMISHKHAEQLMTAFEGFSGWATSQPTKPCEVRWSSCDGLDENIRRNQNSPIMSDSVPAICKPVLLCNGVKIPFPEPVKKLRTLRPRKGNAEAEEGSWATHAVAL